jgi:hypothetical protein
LAVAFVDHKFCVVGFQLWLSCSISSDSLHELANRIRAMTIGLIRLSIQRDGSSLPLGFLCWEKEKGCSLVKTEPLWLPDWLGSP